MSTLQRGHEQAENEAEIVIYSNTLANVKGVEKANINDEQCKKTTISEQGWVERLSLYLWWGYAEVPARVIMKF